jgi:2-oxo-4-hydroxy-4-carboxy--5-ureidoimidazoline (OHCU) decarboxylase
MVAVAQFIPKDPEQKESVLAVLRAHPELQEFIARASEKAEEIFPDVPITLDTVRYD